MKDAALGRRWLGCIGMAAASGSAVAHGFRAAGGLHRACGVWQQLAADAVLAGGHDAQKPSYLHLSVTSGQ